MSEFLDKLNVEQVEDVTEEGRGTWKVLTPFRYQSDIFKGIITVPTGFVTDFASIPRIPFVFDTLGDRGNEAATVHDYLYTVPHLIPSRKLADQILKEALMVQGVPSWMAWQFYFGVRVGGGSHWD